MHTRGRTCRLNTINTMRGSTKQSTTVVNKFPPDMDARLIIGRSNNIRADNQRMAKHRFALEQSGRGRIIAGIGRQ